MNQVELAKKVSDFLRIPVSLGDQGDVTIPWAGISVRFDPETGLFTLKAGGLEYTHSDLDHVWGPVLGLILMDFAPPGTIIRVQGETESVSLIKTTNGFTPITHDEDRKPFVVGALA